jgi:hypothetical protein
MVLTLPFPTRECGVCFESLALVGHPVVLVGPCGHCVHKSCLSEWDAARERGNFATKCPSRNQGISFSFGSDSDEQIENGDTDTGIPALRQAVKGVHLWRRIVAGILFPLLMAVTFYEFLLRRKVSDDMWEVVAFGGAHLWIGILAGIFFPEDIATFLLPGMLIALQVERSDTWDTVAWDFFYEFLLATPSLVLVPSYL